MSNRLLPIALAAALLGGCGARYDDAVVLEGQGRYAAAAEEYKRFALAHPAAPEAPKALLSAAGLYALKLGVCRESRPLLERLARNYPDFRMPEDDFRRIFICPDYFPVGEGRSWYYGDSQTLGRNASQRVAVVDHTSKGAVVNSAFYAGKALVSRQKLVYSFLGLDFLERQPSGTTLVLSYPLDEGKAWSARAMGGRVDFRVEKTGLEVKVKAGAFQDCVKIRRRPAGAPSWIYEYYAPWVGRVLTAVGGPGYEHRVTELLSYEKK